MAADRKAARQQRLRGAQTREPQDINFAFTLPAPPAPRATRNTVTPSSSRSARVIPTRGRGSSSSRRSGSTRKRIEQKTPSDSRSEKRQRIEVGGDASGRRPAQNIRTPERDIAEDELSSVNPIAQSSLRIDEEVTESPRNAPGSGQRQHFSFDPADRGTPTKLKTPRDATRRARKSERAVPSPELDAVDEIDELSPDQPRTARPGDEELDELSPDQPRTRQIAKETPADSARKASRRRSAFEEADALGTPDVNTAKKRRRQSAHEEPDELEGEEILNLSTAKKRHRGSAFEETEKIPGASKKRQRQSALKESDSLDDASTQPKSRRHRSSALERELEEQTLTKEIPNIDEPEEAEEIPIADAAKKLVSKRRRRSAIEEAEQTYTKPPRSGPPTKASPAKQRAPKTRKPSGVKRRGAVPVTAYRMTHHDSDSGDDILNRAIPFASRSGVNAVDVLSQACDEFSGSAVEALGRGLDGASSSAERREYRTKLLAVEAFAEEARWKLMELTISLDAEYAVRKRVRAVLKEKRELRTELMRLRAEREMVALKMDSVRIRHEEEGKDNETLISLSTTLHDVALAASLSRDNVPGDSLAAPPLPVVIDDVAAIASSKSGEGGLLRQLREFNRFLERVAGAVEGR